MLFDQLLVPCDVQQQIDDAVLLGNPDPSFGLGGRGRSQRQHGEHQRQAGARGGLDQSIP